MPPTLWGPSSQDENPWALWVGLGYYKPQLTCGARCSNALFPSPPAKEPFVFIFSTDRFSPREGRRRKKEERIRLTATKPDWLKGSGLCGHQKPPNPGHWTISVQQIHGEATGSYILQLGHPSTSRNNENNYKNNSHECY